MAYRDEYVAQLKTEVERCNSRIGLCTVQEKTADAARAEIVRSEMRSLRERRRKALGRLKLFVS